MNIGRHTIGERPYIIAEIGVNHDGSVDRCLGLVDDAADAGADAIKLQLFEATRLMSSASRLATYQQAAGERDPLSMLRRLELPIRDMARVVHRAHSRGIHAIVSVFSVELVAEAETLAWDAYKTASPDIINKPLLDALAATGRPLIVSTGAATLEEVSRAVAWLGPAHDRLALLQCVSSYPAAPENAAIGAMRDLSRAFGGPIGYSDHTTGEDTGALAVSLGATILEKHFTYDRAAQGPDHAASLDFAGFARYAALARRAAGTPPPASDPRIGPEEKRVLTCEQDVRHVSRQSLTTTRALTAGHAITRADLTIKRPGVGLPPFMLDESIGRTLARAVEADAPLTQADLTE
jgi:N,N'-diacetyllegionaminate synthase